LELIQHFRHSTNLKLNEKLSYIGLRKWILFGFTNVSIVEMKFLKLLKLKYCFPWQRYYYYIHNGIDTEHVAPMEDSWLENVLGLVSEELKVITQKLLHCWFECACLWCYTKHKCWI
jgi:hypothetical protein